MIQRIAILFALTLAAAGCDRTGQAAAAAAPAAAVEAPPVAVEALPGLAARMTKDGPNGRFMGAILVAKGDQVLFRQAYGMADRAAGQPMALDSRFRIASLSKQFTAAAILKLQDEGRLSVDDPLCKWFNPCPDAWRPIRLSHLLSHTSGVVDLMARPDWGLVRQTPQTVAQLTAETAKYRLQFQPGTRIRYSNAAYNLLGVVVERASGQPLHAYLHDKIFAPLDMHDTGYAEGARGLAMGYANFPAGVTAQPEANPSIVFAAGALYSTVDDMLKWSRALHHGRVLSARGYAQMIASHNPPGELKERGRPARDYGYGLFAAPIGGRTRPGFYDRQIYHTGSWSGFRNLVTYQPDADVTVVVLSNNYHQRDQVFLLSQQAMAEALGRPIPTAMGR